MAKAFALACRKCGRRFSAAAVVPGRLAPCPKCGGALALLGKAVLACSACRSRSKPLAVEISRPLVCAKCQGALTIAAVEESPTLPAAGEEPTLRVKPSQAVGDDATLAPQLTPGEVR
ncbi:MAG: zinc ribbon-containing protein, partial [Planctomycetota bacterium]|nr:zinc ribbon-containing protein [Planctomycetota bacterium]